MFSKLVGGGKRLTARVVGRERSTAGPKDKHPGKAAPKLLVDLKEEGGEASVAQQMLAAGVVRLPSLRKVCGCVCGGGGGWAPGRAGVRDVPGEGREGSADAPYTPGTSTWYLRPCPPTPSTHAHTCPTPRLSFLQQAMSPDTGLSSPGLSSPGLSPLPPPLRCVTRLPRPPSRPWPSTRRRRARATRGCGSMATRGTATTRTQAGAAGAAPGAAAAAGGAAGGAECRKWGGELPEPLPAASGGGGACLCFSSCCCGAGPLAWRWRGGHP